jgi:hypothetical protein
MAIVSRAAALAQRIARSPANNTTAANPSRMISDVSPLVVNTSGGGKYSVVTATFECRTPSTRLSGCLYFGNDQGVTLQTSGASAWKLTLDAWAQTKDGIWLQGNNIRSAVPLPTFYEFTTMVPTIRGQVTVPNLPGTGLGATTLWAWAEWEPAPGDNIEVDELARLFRACSFIAQKIGVTQTGA